MQALWLLHRPLSSVCSSGVTSGGRSLLSGPVGDAQIVAGRIEDAKVGQAPRTASKVLLQWPPGRHDPVAFCGHVVDLEHEFGADGRAPTGGGPRNGPPGRPYPDAASSQRDVGFGIPALVFGHLEAEDPGVEVHRGVQVRGEDLKPQRHAHPRMVAHLPLVTVNRVVRGGIKPPTFRLSGVTDAMLPPRVRVSCAALGRIRVMLVPPVWLARPSRWPLCDWGRRRPGRISLRADALATMPSLLWGVVEVSRGLTARWAWAVVPVILSVVFGGAWSAWHASGHADLGG